jgi:carbamoyl-phosphate synthase large subunit
MPKRHDIQRILIIGSGPIVIGQACEFDYSGTQALKALRQEGYEVILVNSNPATIMTDPRLADRTYVEPLSVEYLERIIAKERPQALLPTVGGQTALNLTLELDKAGVLKRYGVEVLGANIAAIEVAEDRGLFRAAMQDIGLKVPISVSAHTVAKALQFGDTHGYPLVLRPSFTLGGSGGGIAYNRAECQSIAARGLDLSPVGQVLVEPCLVGYKEFELEVMRDCADNAVVVCSIENLDPMGVHTGDSITVAPAQTLTDRDYQAMRNAAIAILRRVGVETGGSNVQFAVNPADGDMLVIEMNPRVSRSSALASKATGYPIAKIAAKLAVGYHLSEIPNDITLKTPAAFEPTLDYVVTKIPKFAFEKFPGADATLGTQMKSVGEVMAIGRTFKESLFKAIRSLEAVSPYRPLHLSPEAVRQALTVPQETRLHVLLAAMEQGMSAAEVTRLSRIDPWFVDQMHQLAELQRLIRGQSLLELCPDTLRCAKHWGFSDRRLADLMQTTAAEVRRVRRAAGLQPVYRRVDTCAAEFESHTPYLYSTYEAECEAAPTACRKVLILGSGPNRIGQGIEFDYCCCHAAMALQTLGVQSIMVNCNPETVSTDYDTSDRLYFEPLTLEDVLEIVRVEQPEGVIVQFGGQTPLNLTAPLAAAGVPILGTPPDSIDLAENRQRFNALLDTLNISYPQHGFARTPAEAVQVAQSLGYPVLVRPSYVLGGRAMAIVYSPEELGPYVGAAFAAAQGANVLIDKFLEDAFEYDVDALCDPDHCIIAGIMEHIEEAGVHSGDSSSVLPAYKISAAHVAEIKQTTRRMAKALGVVGLMNVQFAIAEGKLYVIEVNPRASRTVPYVAKATGVELAKVATQLMLGKTLAELGLQSDLEVDRFYVKAPVFPFAKFLGVDPKLSPEMRSTGEVMGVDTCLGVAFYKAQLAAGMRLPTQGGALITVNARDHEAVVPTAQRLHAMGFTLLATRGNAAVLRAHGLPVTELLKNSEGRPNCLDALKSGQVQLIINTPLGAAAHQDGWHIRTAAIEHRVPLVTTLSGAAAAVEAIAQCQAGHHLQVTCLQDLAAKRDALQPT